MAEKYVIFKVDEFRAWYGQLSVGGTSHEIPAPFPISDAVVIRRQDIFAPPVLDAYASSILIALQLQEDPSKYAGLRAIADYFHQQATLAWNTQRKVPD